MSAQKLNVTWNDVTSRVCFNSLQIYNKKGTCYIPTKQIIMISYNKAGLMSRMQNYIVHVSADYQQNT